MINRKERAKKILIQFLEKEAPNELNISSNDRVKIMQKYKKSEKDGEYPNDLFDEAYKSCLNDLRYDNFPRFVLTDKFLSWVKNACKKMGYEEFKKSFIIENVTKEKVDSEFK